MHARVGQLPAGDLCQFAEVGHSTPASRPTIPGWYIAVEGATGVGKTTLAERLAPVLSAVFFRDPFDRNPFLAPREGIPAGSGEDLTLAAELTFLALRIGELRCIAAALQAGSTVITDWALAKTRVFPRTTLAPGDADRVEAACGLWQPGLRSPDLIIYLRASPAVLASRIAARGRAFERTITIPDLARLSALFDTALSGLPVLQVDADTFDVFDAAAVTAMASQITVRRKDSSR